MPALLRLVMIVIKLMLEAQDIPFGRASGTCPNDHTWRTNRRLSELVPVQAPLRSVTSTRTRFARGAGAGSPRVAGAVEVDQDRIQRAGRADEQVVALGAAEGEVGHDLRNMELSDQRAVRVEAVQPVRGRRPDPAARVETDAVEGAGIAVAKTSPLLTAEAPVTAKTRMCLRRLSEMYSCRSSAENASPLGRSKSSAITCSAPEAGSSRYT